MKELFYKPILDQMYEFRKEDFEQTVYDNNSKIKEIELLECWNRRKKRVDYNNIFIIMCIGPNGDEEIVKRFGTIKFDNKILLSSNIDIDKYPYCFNMKCYEYGYKDSLIQHINKYSLKRYLDEFDWLHFFKGKD